MKKTLYIGAKCVPSFYIGSGGSSEWASGIPFEPLTIVTYETRWYISKKPVPAAAGAPEPGEYWARVPGYVTDVTPEELQAILDDIGDLDDLVTTAKTNLVSAVNEVKGETTELRDDLSDQGFSQDARIALLDCFAHVAWIDEHGQDYYDALDEALSPNLVTSISAVFTQGTAVIYADDDLDVLRQYLVVTATYQDQTTGQVNGYVLNGTLVQGTSTITVKYAGKTDTFNVTVSAAYWDYEWNASSQTLPEGMTAYRYNFTDEPGAMFVANPVLNFDYIGNCRFMIECKWYCYDEDATTGEFKWIIKGGNNPQLFALNKTVNGNKSGSRVIGHADGQSDEQYDLRLLTGNNTDYFGQKDNVYHTFDLVANDNDCSISIPDLEFTISGSGLASQYNPHTGINSPAATGSSTIHIKGLFIKSIKFKRL